jgi:predicted ATPase
LATSNIVSFFRMLGFMTTWALQEFVGRHGGSDSFLHYGRETTQQIQAQVEFEGGGRKNTYLITLADAAPDTLIFTNEAVEFHQEGYPQPRPVPLGSGHKESALREGADADDTCRVLLHLLRNCRTYQFHDTSSGAKVRKEAYIQDARYLRDDAGNLAAFLNAMRGSHPDCYHRIVETVRMAFPLFDDFELEPSRLNEANILLNWREKGRVGHLFGPHQLSDGTLRFMALTALFLQPAENLPGVIVIDEPELGLHPYAVSLLAAMIKSASANCQVVLATQSVTFVNHFLPENVVVVEREDNASVTRRLDPKQLAVWMEEYGYGVGDMWDRNMFGGRP